MIVSSVITVSLKGIVFLMYKERKFSVSSVFCVPLKITDTTFVCVLLPSVLIYTFLKFLSEIFRRAHFNFLWQFDSCFINNLVWQDLCCLLANQLFQLPVLRKQTSNLESYVLKVQVCLQLGFLCHLQKV